MFRKLLSIISFALLLQSCIEKEIPVEPFPRQGLTLSQVFSGANYENQIWFSLSQNSTVNQADRLSWDLKFSTHFEKPWLRLNTSRVMQAAISNAKDFSSVNSDAGLTYIHDFSSGSTDSIAATRWWEHDNVIFIDLGFDPIGNPLGKRKIKPMLNGSTITIQYGNIADITPQVIEIELSSAYSNNYVSLINGSLVQPEPPKGAYDLLFTNYTYQFWNPFLQYLVYGVLLADGAKAVEINDEIRTKIAANQLESIVFSENKDAIGYNWKTYNFDLMAFEIHSEKEYIIKSVEGFYFKLRFIDFYNEQGVRGAPKFEFEQL